MKVKRVLILILSVVFIFFFIFKSFSQDGIKYKYYLVKNSDGKYILNINEKYKMFHSTDKFAFSVYPNPIINEVTIKINAKENNIYDTKIFSYSNGEKTLIWTGKLSKGENLIQIKEDQYLTNSEMIIIENGRFTKSINLIK